VDAKHTVIAQTFEEKVNSLLKGREERQPTKKKTIVFCGSISKNKLLKIPSKKRMCHKKNF
jgi:hypothetical protein